MKRSAALMELVAEVGLADQVLVDLDRWAPAYALQTAGYVDRMMGSQFAQAEVRSAATPVEALRNWAESARECRIAPGFMHELTDDEVAAGELLADALEAAAALCPRQLMGQVAAMAQAAKDLGVTDPLLVINLAKVVGLLRVCDERGLIEPLLQLPGFFAGWLVELWARLDHMAATSAAWESGLLDAIAGEELHQVDRPESDHGPPEVVVLQDAIERHGPPAECHPHSSRRRLCRAHVRGETTSRQ